MLMSPRWDRLAILNEIRRSSRRLTLEASIRGILGMVHQFSFNRAAHAAQRSKRKQGPLTPLRCVRGSVSSRSVFHAQTTNLRRSAQPDGDVANSGASRRGENAQER